MHSGHTILNSIEVQLDYNSHLLEIFQDMSENNMNQQSQSQMQQPQSSTHQQNNQNQDLSNCDLTNLESLTCNDSDELLRQLTENTFELETFFSEFSTADIKVRKAIHKKKEISLKPWVSGGK